MLQQHVKKKIEFILALERPTTVKFGSQWHIREKDVLAMFDQPA